MCQYACVRVERGEGEVGEKVQKGEMYVGRSYVDGFDTVNMKVCTV